MAAKGKFFRAIKELTGNNNINEEKRVEASIIKSKETNQEEIISTPLKPSTIISSSMIVEGEIKSASDIQVIGTVKGPITTSGNLIVKGKVLGDIRGNNITLAGCAVQGNVFAEGDIMLDADAVVLGDIQAQNISMNPGAKLNGKVTILSNKIKEESPFSHNFEK